MTHWALMLAVLIGLLAVTFSTPASASAPAALSLTPQPPPRTYRAQAGDTLALVAQRFGADAEKIQSSEPLPPQGLLDPGQTLLLPPETQRLPYARRRLPDSEVIFSQSAAGFDTRAYLAQAGGSLDERLEWLSDTEVVPAAEVVDRVAEAYSIHPRLLLALLEQACGCVLGSETGGLKTGYALGVEDYHYRWLNGQLSWAAEQLSAGYYGWRAGLLGEVRLADGTIVPLAPDNNAGTAALQVYFARLGAVRAQQGAAAQTAAQWEQEVAALAALHRRMFGEPWSRAQVVEPIFPAGLRQPPLSLPFEPGVSWNYTSGPHAAWGKAEPRAALDFAPSGSGTGCRPALSAPPAWITAAASGLITRSESGLVVQDLDGDGLESTGWVLHYLHVGESERVQAGVWVEAGARIGHPSCEGGWATGIHLHLSRKYNGEWIPADGPLPFVLDGWQAHAGDAAYEGTLTRGRQTIIANPNSTAATRILRTVVDSTLPVQRIFLPMLYERSTVP